ncbi:hypothetical protein IFM58399_04470 [Aspergillus lentulus]|uniref:DUF7137 domain-containing protein n=1 Tax=Aspergillus lentulus TaxID=293939 RepID=A0AAN5YY10_ASPLE|nr:uncharacterized protein IFM58399_04470 [Aspergillus lentulus]KAF4153038.1 hypothetical protein CNMCM6069_001345 [Aspergillus lentulus]KAF4163179.1 hypothetical protein CNMCM6936_001099 [Aspergillus lentulus]KAF4172866.1 hypothetical protein CNMCM8060_000961 [Aspergillus lentulus]KAF4188015.1 hypothetical protein CNMCM7927_002892 [Aspergillus lentulus]KAF4197402.1 hypothetical protein CNMCM8694_003033 [Aspergillus lentulus]
MQSLNFLSFLSLLLLLGTISSAWPWPQDGLNLAHGEIAARADTTASDESTTDSKASKTDSSSETNTADSTATDSSSGTETATGTAKETGTQTKSGKTTDTATDKSGKNSKTKTSTKTTSIDARLPAGGTSMLIPTAGATTYYKIGDYVTFAWNYTSLLVTPSAVNVLATCTMNSATYTLTSNMSVEATGKVVWDTGKYQANATVPLLTATYTLYVVDVDKDIGDTASPGHLGSQNGYLFGMYSPQAYTPLNEFNCATCNGALSDIERQALKFAFGMVMITIASFTWFAGDFGVFST